MGKSRNQNNQTTTQLRMIDEVDSARYVPAKRGRLALSVSVDKGKLIQASSQ